MATEYQELTRMLCDLSWSCWRGFYVILHVKPLDLAMFERVLLLFILMIWYHRHCYVGMMWYCPRLYEGMMWYYLGLWDGTIRYPPKFSVFSNPWEAAILLYGSLGYHPSTYGVSLGLFHPLIMEEIMPIMWRNLYTSTDCSTMGSHGYLSGLWGKDRQHPRKTLSCDESTFSYLA